MDDTILSAPIPSAHSSAPVIVSASARASNSAAAAARLSYKFQRLREKVRQAIASGELTGKLPGERTLARRFHVNAKTLSKALTDLAAEGVLDRSIGRGTYVKGSAPAGAPARWLVLVDPGQEKSSLVQLLQAAHAALDVATDLSAMRPSFLNQFDAVIDLAGATPESFVRSLVVRNIPVVAIGREPRTFSTHAVLPDLVLAATQIGRELLLAGHRRLAVVEGRGKTALADSLRKTAARIAPDAQVDACFPEEMASIAASGATAVICESPETAAIVMTELARIGAEVPEQISVAAVGYAADDAPCSGCFVPVPQAVETVQHLLGLDGQSIRPATVYLTPRYVDRATIRQMMSLEAGMNSPMRVPYPAVSA